MSQFCYKANDSIYKTSSGKVKFEERLKHVMK